MWRASRIMQAFLSHYASRTRGRSELYLTSIFTTLWSMMAGFWLIFKLNPSPALVLCNGPGTCLPVVVAAYVLRLVSLGRVAPRIVFIESFCRVNTMSLTGKILYHLRIADRFVVQWKKLASMYPRAEYVGTIY